MNVRHGCPVLVLFLCVHACVRTCVHTYAILRTLWVVDFRIGVLWVPSFSCSRFRCLFCAVLETMCRACPCLSRLGFYQIDVLHSPASLRTVGVGLGAVTIFDFPYFLRCRFSIFRLFSPCVVLVMTFLEETSRICPNRIRCWFLWVVALWLGETLESIRRQPRRLSLPGNSKYVSS